MSDVAAVEPLPSPLALTGTSFCVVFCEVSVLYKCAVVCSFEILFDLNHSLSYIISQ